MLDSNSSRTVHPPWFGPSLAIDDTHTRELEKIQAGFVNIGEGAIVVLMKVLEGGGAGWSKEHFECSATRWLEKSGPDPCTLGMGG